MDGSCAIHSRTAESQAQLTDEKLVDDPTVACIYNKVATATKPIPSHILSPHRRAVISKTHALTQNLSLKNIATLSS